VRTRSEGVSVRAMLRDTRGAPARVSPRGAGEKAASAAAPCLSSAAAPCSAWAHIRRREVAEKGAFIGSLDVTGRVLTKRPVASYVSTEVTMAALTGTCMAPAIVALIAWAIETLERGERGALKTSPLAFVAGAEKDTTTLTSRASLARRYAGGAVAEVVPEEVLVGDTLLLSGGENEAAGVVVGELLEIAFFLALREGDTEKDGVDVILGEDVTLGLSSSLGLSVGVAEEDTVTLPDAASLSLGNTLEEGDRLPLKEGLPLKERLAVNEPLTLPEDVSLSLAVKVPEGDTLPLKVGLNVYDTVTLPDAASLSLGVTLKEGEMLPEDVSLSLRDTVNEPLPLPHGVSLPLPDEDGLLLSVGLTV
jgi:hypothetical protein